jgi:hypothetical protein
MALLILPAFAWAALDEDEVRKELAGRYRLQTSEGTISFLIRSAGNVEILNEGDEFKYASGRITYSYSNSDELIDGLPVANLVIGAGSDEDMKDYHVILVVEQDEGGNTMKVVASFSTFNDGPNGYATSYNESMKLSKFDKKTDKFIELE